jgi:hypothetical protein
LSSGAEEFGERGSEMGDENSIARGGSVRREGLRASWAGVAPISRDALEEGDPPFA